VSGFLTGTLSGVTGLVVKPLSGALDFFSITTEGIRNTSKKDEEFIREKRLREPKITFDKMKLRRNYEEESEEDL
jgi:vacuolar protein sorting-associated protein 13A/C